MQERRSNADRTEETRRALLEASRALFVERGFQGTSTPEVVARASVTRGALYHHFEDKLALFRAVVEAEAAAVAREIEEGAREAEDALDALRRGARAYFKAMGDPARARLMLVDGPAALGPQEMRRIDLETGGRELRIGLAEAMAGHVTKADIEARADLISAMFDRAALARANGAPRAAYERALDAVLVAVVAAQPRST
jgi:AcrR family transcriptional regulator